MAEEEPRAAVAVAVDVATEDDPRNEEDGIPTTTTALDGDGNGDGDRAQAWKQQQRQRQILEGSEGSRNSDDPSTKEQEASLRNSTLTPASPLGEEPAIVPEEAAIRPSASTTTTTTTANLDEQVALASTPSPSTGDGGNEAENQSDEATCPNTTTRSDLETVEMTKCEKGYMPPIAYQSASISAATTDLEHVELALNEKGYVPSARSSTSRPIPATSMDVQPALDKTAYNGGNAIESCDRLRVVAMVLDEEPSCFETAAASATDDTAAPQNIVKNSRQPSSDSSGVGAFYASPAGLTPTTSMASSQTQDLSRSVMQQQQQCHSPSLATDDVEHGLPSVETSSHLVEATLVTDQAQQEQQQDSSILVEAELVIKRRRRIRTSILALGVLFFLGVGAIVAYVVTQGRNDGGDPSSSSEAGKVVSSIHRKPTLEHILEQGVLRCGVMPETTGNFFQAERGVENLFEADFCRAIAAAIMGKDNFQYELIEHKPEERVNLIGQGEVDVILHMMTGTMDRDVYLDDLGTGLSFSTPYFYFRTAFGGDPKYVACAENGLQTTDECAGLKVCVHMGTRHYEMLALQLPKTQLTGLPMHGVIYDRFIDGTCNVILSSTVELNAIVFILDVMYGQGDSNFVIGEGLYTYEPVSIVTRDDDTEFSDFVNWVLQALLAAEQHGITKDNIMLMSGDVPKFRQPSVFGDQYKDMFYDAVAAVGNYGEIYERLSPEIYPRNLVNSINNGTTGLIHASPLGFPESNGPPPPEDGILMTIVARGKLRCGIRTQNRPGFAQKVSHENRTSSRSSHAELLDFQGMDIDFCCAVATAIFATGTVERIEFVEIPTVEDGLRMLQSGELDIVAGVMKTLERDVREPSTGLPFSFTNPYFYNHTAAASDDSNLCLVTRQDDLQWSSFVFWIVEATFYAEENGITMALSNDMPTVNLFGPDFQRMFRDAILSVGNYGEIYERNVQPFVPRSGLNLLYDGLGPLHYPLTGLLE